MTPELGCLHVETNESETTKLARQQAAQAARLSFDTS